ncbi:MAG: hypothetical protein HC842_03270 [Cytophagales bacterium]|nr:hypothetical protein [Cytophagales bacterium]
MKRLIYPMRLFVLAPLVFASCCKEELVISDSMSIYFYNYRYDTLEIHSLWKDTLYSTTQTLLPAKEFSPGSSVLDPGRINVGLVSRKLFNQTDSLLHLVVITETRDTLLTCFNKECNYSDVKVIEDLREEGGRGSYVLIYELGDE